MSEQPHTEPAAFLADRIVRISYGDLSASVVERSKTFLLDTLGVSVAGSHGFRVHDIQAMAEGWGTADEATVWVSGARVAAPTAALINAYQAHSLEFDCVHDEAVLHPMSAILSSLMAYCERRTRRGLPVRGKDFLAAMVGGVDIAVFMGMAATGPTRFFRPGTAGGFGAAAAIAKLSGLEDDRILRVLGNQYAQTCGTMQSHVEGSPLLGLQIGFNARAAIMSNDLLDAGIAGPVDVFTGQYGYFRLMEGEQYDLGPALDALHSGFQVERLSHKPYPTGRLMHGCIDAVDTLMRRHSIRPDQIAQIECRVPPIVYRLVSRPDMPRPTPNYAKLCMSFVIGTLLNHGRVDFEHFIGDAMLNEERTHAFAALVVVIQSDVASNKAMMPISVSISLQSGETHIVTLDVAFGHPDNRLSQAQNLEKFWRCWERVPGLSREAGKTVIEMVSDLEKLDDVSTLVECLVAPH